MSRTSAINETIAILGKVLPEQGFPALDADKLQEIYTALENLGKDQKDTLTQELGFKLRKRSTSKKVDDTDSSPKEPKVTRKTGYSCFPGDSEYKSRVDDLFEELKLNGDKPTKSKAKAAIWNTLSEEQKEPFNIEATNANRENGLPEKKTSSPKEPKLTNAQVQEQLRLTQEVLRQQGITDMPAPPPKEPKKKKDSNSSSPISEQERNLSPPVQIPNSIQIGQDSDSDTSESPSEPQHDDYNHIQWSVNLVNDSDEGGPKADFIAWLISERPSEFGPTMRNTIFNEDEIKQFKQQYNFKNMKKDPTSPWHDFIKIHSSQ
jgi:hypothetical protein|tara:strand:+ start:333 stop:1292 length:960 start_codon:yes stop_codon:yes gene_type:complete